MPNADDFRFADDVVKLWDAEPARQKRDRLVALVAHAVYASRAASRVTQRRADAALAEALARGYEGAREPAMGGACRRVKAAIEAAGEGG
jgi:hypothetical protein